MSQQQFNKGVKLHKIAAGMRDKYRPVMEFIFFAKGFAYTTNTHILIKAKLSEISTLSEESISNLDNVLLHYSLFDQILKYDSLKVENNQIICKKQGFCHEVIFNLIKNGDNFTYPDAEKVISYYKAKKHSTDSPRYDSHNLSLLLKTLRSCIKTPTIVLEFKANYCTFINVTNHETFGLLMQHYKD